MKLKNRCTVTLRQGYETIGTYRPDDDIFQDLRNELEPYRSQYAKPVKTKIKKYTAVLMQEDIKMGTYRLNKTQLNSLIKKIDKFRSLPEPKKKVRCVETGQIFESAREASKWVEFVREIDYCHHDYIKLVCKGKHKTCFGYHWEFVNDNKVCNS